MLIPTRKSDERIWIKKDICNKLKTEVSSEFEGK